MWIVLQKGNLESLLDRAKELEKKYEWLRATEFYHKAVTQTIETKDFFETAKLQEKVGYCYFRAALQAQQPEQNKKRMKQSIKAYDSSVDSIEKNSSHGHKAKIAHNQGWSLFLKSWLETDLLKKKKLLEEWWKLESSNFKIYDELDDHQSAGKIYNDLIELSAVDRFFTVTDNSELRKIAKEGVELGEKAIKFLLKANNINELARAYCWTSWNYGFSILYALIDSDKEKYYKKTAEYSKKAIELAKKTGDAWLIGWSNNARSLYFAAIKHLKKCIEYGQIFVNQGRIAKDNYMLAVGLAWLGNSFSNLVYTIEDPDKQRDCIKKALNYHKEGKNHADLSNFHLTRLATRNGITFDLEKLASYETNLATKKATLRQLIRTAKETLKLAPEWYQYQSWSFRSLSLSLFKLAEIISDSDKKHQLLLKALNYQEKYITLHKRFLPKQYGWRSSGFVYKAQIEVELAKLEENEESKNGLIKTAILSMETSLTLHEKAVKNYAEELYLANYGHKQYRSGKILFELYSLTKKTVLLAKAIALYNEAIEQYKLNKQYSNLAEAYWQKSKNQDHIGEHSKSAENYELASEAYLNASNKLPKFKDFYLNYSLYMRAWSVIELAKYYHSIEDYEKAQQNYEQAAGLHQKLDDWNYLSPNYFAWAKLEQAEESSRKEKPKEAKENFQKAIDYFKKTETNINTKIKENPTAEEKDLMTGILKASDLRQKYCQARILMEEAKFLDREGKFLDSSKKYGEASQKISAISDKVDVEVEHKELGYIAILCQAWQKMANAEETTSSESYLEAAELFEQAKDHCYTKKASLWALGNSYFCKGLAAQNQFQKTLDRSFHSKANKFVKQAAGYYKEAGYQKASEYARATQRLFDAYLYMNSAEDEVDTEKKTKYYQLAEQLLKIAANAFSKAQQADKTTQVQSILGTVREEKALAASLNAVMQTPTIASTTQSFTAPSPTSEVSVGLESFDHANVQANLVSNISEVKVGESFSLSVEFVNAGREPALLTRVEDFVPSGFVVVKKPEIYRIEETTLNMKGKQLAPLKLVEVKLTLQPSKKGIYLLNPRVHYLDELGQNKSLQLKTLEIEVEEVLLEDRVSTGTQELDSLLLGGIPQEYAVVLSGSPSDEREYLIKNFLNAGIKEDEVVYYASTEADGLETLLKNPSFYLFLCNPKPKTQVPDLPNIFKLRSKTDLTNLSILLAKAYRNIDQSKKKRICIEIVSDVLISYKTEATRRWISELITDLGFKGFTMLAVMDPKEHPPDQATTVINLFDGEIELTQTGDPLECRKSVRVKKLRNQDYIKNPICLT